MPYSGASDPLVLQPGMVMARPFMPVGSSGALLMSSAPGGPVESGLGPGRRLPDEMPEQTADLRHGHGQEVGGEIGAVLSPRWRLCAGRRDRRARAWPG